MTARAFFVAADGRPHAPWRILLFLVITAVVMTLATVALFPVARAVNKWVGEGLGFSETVLVALSLLAAHFVMLRWIDRKPWSHVALHREAARLRLLITGWWLGAWTIALPSALLFGVGMLTVIASAPGSWWVASAKVTATLIPAAFEEELLSRGYLFATLREWLGRWTALLTTSLGFGLLHLGNPGADVWSITMVTLAGIFLGVVLLATGSLYAAWMAHWSWNWVMAVPMHIAVSGLPLPYPDYKTVETGPDWLTGGQWGPEGGMAAAFGMLLGFGYIYWRYRKPSTDPSLRSG